MIRFLPFLGLIVGTVSELARARRRNVARSGSRAVFSGRGSGL